MTFPTRVQPIHDLTEGKPLLTVSLITHTPVCRLLGARVSYSQDLSVVKCTTLIHPLASNVG